MSAESSQGAAARMNATTAANPPCHAGSTAGAVVLTPALMEEACLRHNGYRTPELNRTLYLHHMNLCQLCSFASYHSCTVLYLSHNVLDDLTALAPLVHLHSLYLAQNALTRCDRLPTLPALRLIDLTHNALQTLSGLAQSAPGLETVLAAHNQLTQVDEVAGLKQLCTLDLSGNALTNSSEVLGTLQRNAATLRTCLLSGNPVVRQMTSYRYRLIHALPVLGFLDERPVSPEEREMAAAHALAGAPAVEQVRARVAKSQAKQRDDAFDEYTRLREGWREEGRAAAGRDQPAHRTLPHAADNRAQDHGAEDDNIYVGGG